MSSTRRFTTATTGPVNAAPTAVLASTKIDAVIGSIIQLDGRQSFDPEKKPLSFHWNFTRVPIGSVLVNSSFKPLRPNLAAVSFVPDKTGIYFVELTVNDGELDSTPVQVVINIQLSRVPCGEGLVPDASFLWSYISDFWNLVEDRTKFETVWSSIIQEIGADLIALWSNDYNKSLNTIQPTYQRRWQKFSMLSDLTAEVGQKIIVGKTDAGVEGTSGKIGEVPGTGNTRFFYVLKGNPGDGDKTDFTNLNGNYGPKGRVLVINEETHIISRVMNQRQHILSGNDLVTTASSRVVTSAANPFGNVQAGDIFVIKTGADAREYRVKDVQSLGSIQLSHLNDPAGGPYPSTSAATGISYSIYREWTVAVTNSPTIPDGLVQASWRVPHLLHVPGRNLEEEQVAAGDILTFTVTRTDTGLSTEVFAQIVGVTHDRIGFEFSTTDLAPVTNFGSNATIVEDAGTVVVSGLQNMQPSSVGGYLELTNCDFPGSYKIIGYISQEAVIINDVFASGPDSNNGLIGWRERGRTGFNLERDLFKKIVRDLRMVPTQAPELQVNAAAEALISFIPIGINLASRPFTKFGITFKAKSIRHLSAVKVPTDLVSAPSLQERIAEPPVVLRENFDYVIESGQLRFVNQLFSLKSPAPDEFWAECAVFDNGQVVENNFGKLVNLTRKDLTNKKTRAPYLGVVKGLMFAYTNGPRVSNIRLGLQILLGLPFAESQGDILEIQDNFTVDTNGTPLGRMLVEDTDADFKRTGFRRVYFYPTAIGLEVNPDTVQPYKVGDRIARFAPISKGVTVTDYVKDPFWWKRSLFGLEILKYFTFKVEIDGQVFNENDVAFALEFIKAIKPEYVRVLNSAFRYLSQDIIVNESFGGRVVAKFYDNITGLQAVKRVDDQNHQGAFLWNLGSRPFSNRLLNILKDVVTINNDPYVSVSSAAGWNVAFVRGRVDNPGTPNMPVIEGDVFVVLPGFPGAGTYTPSYYEILSVTDANNLLLRSAAPMADPDTLGTDPLVPDDFQYGDGIYATVMRRASNPMVWGTDLNTDGSEIATSASAVFLTNGITVGHHLIIESGPNMGEYVIDAILREGTGATVDWDAKTISGLSGMTTDDIGKTIELDTGDSRSRTYRITDFISGTSVSFDHSNGTTDTITGVDWRMTPGPVYITNTDVALRTLNGTPLSLSPAADQVFRIINPDMSPGIVNNVKSYYNATLARIELQALDGTDPRDVFTPGMVGMTITVSASSDPSNDGEFVITEYIDAGSVVTDSGSVTSDAEAVATLHLTRTESL